MNKTVNLFLAIMFLTPIFGFGQVDIVNGVPFEMTPYFYPKFVLNKGNDQLIVEVTDKDIFMVKTNLKNLSATKQITVKNPKGYVRDVFMFNGKAYIIITEVGTKELEIFRFQEIDFENLGFKGENKELFKSGRPEREIDKLDVFISNDSSKIVFSYKVKKDPESSGKNAIRFCVLGRNMETLSDNIVEMPYDEAILEDIDYVVDSDGNIFVLTKIFDSAGFDSTIIDRDEQINYRVELLRIKANTKVIEKSNIIIPNKFITKINLFTCSGNKFYCAGFYNNQKSLDKTDGLFMFKLGKDGEMVDLKLHAYSTEVLNKYQKSSTEKKKYIQAKEFSEFKGLEIRDFVIEKDGSFLLFAEQRLVDKDFTGHTMSMSVNTMSSANSYYSFNLLQMNDILITKIDSSGNLIWMKNLPKRQKSGSSSTSIGYQPKRKAINSYALIKGANGYSILFLDNNKNSALGFDDYPFYKEDLANEGDLMAYKINGSSGEAKKVFIFELKNVLGTTVLDFYRNRIVQSGLDEFVAYFKVERKKAMLTKVKLK